MAVKEIVIGHARLLLGDARELAATVGPVDLIFTDPPYGHNNNNNDLIHNREKALGRKAAVEPSRPILNDDKEAAHDLAAWLFDAAPGLLRSGGCCCCCCCCGGGGPDPQFARWALMMDNHLAFKQMVIWDKGKIGMGWHYRRSYECVLVGQKRGGKCKWHDQTKKVENIIRPGDYGIRKIIPSKAMHPTPKPPELAEHFIRLHTLRGDTVFDPFMGAGSTGVAAIRRGRKFVGIELDPQWFGMAEDRLSDAVRQFEDAN